MNLIIVYQTIGDRMPVRNLTVIDPPLEEAMPLPEADLQIDMRSGNKQVHSMGPPETQANRERK